MGVFFPSKNYGLSQTTVAGIAATPPAAVKQVPGLKAPQQGVSGAVPQVINDKEKPFYWGASNICDITIGCHSYCRNLHIDSSNGRLE